MRHQHRYPCVAQHVTGDAAEQALAQAPVAVAAHHQQVGAAIVGMGQQPVGDALAGAGKLIDRHRGAVPRKRGREIGAGFLAMGRRAGFGIDDRDMHTLGPFDEGHRVGDGACRLAAGRPGDHHPLAEGPS
jgi:hypothetical protein